MWAILADPNKKGRKWDPAAFFQSGEAAIDHLMQQIAQFNFPLQHGTALDFGCGLGRLTQGICKHFAKTYGIDISPTMVSEAARYNQYGCACEYVVNNSNDLGRFDDNTFDFICSSIVLQHIWPEASKIYMAEFVRVLRPGGLLFFQLPSALRQTQAQSQGPQEKTVKMDQESGPAVVSRKPASWQRVRKIFSRRKHSATAKPEESHVSVESCSNLERLVEMHGIPREEVCSVLERSHGTVIRVQEDECCGPEWISFRYWVTKS